jgi:hypothetical protein
MMGAAGAARDVDFVSSSIAFSSTATNTVAAPSDIKNGDLLVAVGFCSANRTISSYPAGFTQILGNSASINSVVVATKIASSESGSYSFVWSGNNVNNFAILVYRNASDESILVGSVTRADSNVSTGSSITPSSKGVLIGLFAIEALRDVSVAPSEMVQRSFINAQSPSMAIYDILSNESGSTGNKTLTWTGGSTENAGLLFQIYRR